VARQDSTPKTVKLLDHQILPDPDFQVTCHSSCQLAFVSRFTTKLCFDIHNPDDYFFCKCIMGAASGLRTTPLWRPGKPLQNQKFKTKNSQVT
jgi:hypothetical protein